MTWTFGFSAALIEWSEVRASKSEQTSICPGKDFMDEMLSAIHRGKQALKHLIPIGGAHMARVLWPAARRPLVLNVPLLTWGETPSIPDPSIETSGRRTEPD